MPTRLAATTLLVTLAAMPPAIAQDERYALERTDDGYVRMDLRTGQMSLCTEQAGQLVCRLAADDRDAFEQDLDQFAARLAAVEDRLAALEGSPDEALPGEGEFEKSMDYMERFFRRFLDMVKEFDQDARPPDRT
jgi:Mg2+ and Co2+ transporter CorA